MCQGFRVDANVDVTTGVSCSTALPTRKSRTSMTCEPATSGQTADRWSHLQVRVHLGSSIYPNVYMSLVRLQHFKTRNCLVTGMFETEVLFDGNASTEM